MEPIENLLFEAAAAAVEQTCFMLLLPEQPEGLGESPEVGEGQFRMTDLGPCDPKDPGKGMETAFQTKIELYVDEGRFTVSLLSTTPLPQSVGA
jgi:hypothetical protein